jgi:hypothetical protein
MHLFVVEQVYLVAVRRHMHPCAVARDALIPMPAIHGMRLFVVKSIGWYLIHLISLVEYGQVQHFLSCLQVSGYPGVCRSYWCLQQP